MQVCRKCGAMLRETDRFCSQCGTRVPKISAEDRQEKAQKKKQQKNEVTFRTKPEKDTHYREHFAEGENRARALRMTLLVLAVMMAAVAAFAVYSFMIRGRSSSGSSAGSGSSSSGQPSGSAVIEILTEQQENHPDAGSETAAPDEGNKPRIVGEAQSEGQGEAQIQAQSEAQMQEQSEAQTQVQSEAQTQAQTEAQTEAQTAGVDPASLPSAGEEIDTGYIAQILAQESNAYAASVYIYDLLHDSEAFVNDCDEPLRLSAMVTVPILYTAASRIDAGEMSLDDELVYATSIGGRGEMLAEPRDGQSLPVSFYLQTMVNYSDNNCINLLIDYLGLDTINAVCQEAGYASIQLQRGLVAAGNTGGLDNYGSARDITLMIRDLYQDKFSSIGKDFMTQYFHISGDDSLPTLIGLAPSLADASLFLNQNGHVTTRYNESALIEDQGAAYILTIMMSADDELICSPAAEDIAEYVSSAMAPQ